MTCCARLSIVAHDYRLTALDVVDGATPVSSLSYGYSDGINLTAVNDNVTPANAASLGYSATNRLITANGPWGQAAYSYDATGNRLSNVVTLGGNTTTRLQSYGISDNRITGMTENGASLRSYTYDGNGNILTDTRPGEVFAFTYNVRNRPVSVTRNSVAYATYAYNALEQLVSRATSAPGGPSGTVHYIHDLAGHLIAEADGSTGAVTREYIWLEPATGLDPVDLPIGLVQGGNLYMVHTDHLARPIRITDAARATQWQATWGPWGEAQAISGTLALDMRFPGQLFQIETGLHYNWHRHYDPVTGRYTQPDPLRFVDGPAIYAYAGSSPFIYVDEDGENARIVIGALAGGLGNFAYQMYKYHGNWRCVNYYQVGAWALAGSGLGSLANSIARGGWATFGRFFWDSRKFSTISRAYWKARRGANGMSIDHVFFQAAVRSGRIPAGLANVGWNQLVIPREWNMWLGFAKRWGRWPAAQARLTRLGMRVGLPSYVAGFAYLGGRLGNLAKEEYCGCNQ